MLLLCSSDGDISGVTSRSGRVLKKSTKLMDFTSPDDIETVKAKKQASASKKLNMVRHSSLIIIENLILQTIILDSTLAYKNGTRNKYYTLTSKKT